MPLASLCLFIAFVALGVPSQITSSGDAVVSGLYDCYEVERGQLSDDCERAMHAFRAGRLAFVSQKEEYCLQLATERLAVKIDEIPPTAAVSSMFEDHMLKLRPFKSSCAACSLGPHVPRVLANNYLRRVEGVQHLMQPATLDGGSEGSTFLCPAHLHLVAWLQQGSATLTLRDERAARFWSSSIGNASMADLLTVRSSADKDPMCPPPAKQRLLQANLQGGDFLFVPHPFAVSLSAETDAVKAVCYLDASNFNTVLEYLERADSADGRQILRALSSAAFDRSMRREAADLPVDEYLQFQQLITAPAAAQESRPELQQQEQKQRRRRRGGGGEYKVWQETVAWDSLIASKTIPKPASLHDIVMGRSSAVLSLHEATSLWTNEEGNSKASARGLRLSTCTLGPDTVLFDDFLLDSTGSASLRTAQWTAASCWDVDYGADQLQLTDLTAQLTAVQLTANGLKPDEFYQFQLRRLHDGASSPRTAWSARMRALPVTAPSVPQLTAPATHTAVRIPSPTWLQSFRSADIVPFVRIFSITLTAALPSDNGGLSAIYWEVSAMVAGERLPVDWRMLPCNSSVSSEGVRVSVTALRPGLTYTLRLRACNAVGCSAYSLPATHSARVSDVLIDDDERTLLSHAPPPGSLHTVIAVDTAAQEIAVPSIGMMSKLADVKAHTDIFQVWRCHWSPAADLVLAAAVFFPATVDERTAGKVVFLRRDGTALHQLALLAQQAGAVALVVVDDGRCTEYDQRCIPGATKALGEGFAAQDIPFYWAPLRIPVVFVTTLLAEQIQGQLQETHLASAVAATARDEL